MRGRTSKVAMMAARSLMARCFKLESAASPHACAQRTNMVDRAVSLAFPATPPSGCAMPSALSHRSGSGSVSKVQHLVDSPRSYAAPLDARLQPLGEQSRSCPAAPSVGLGALRPTADHTVQCDAPGGGRVAQRIAEQAQLATAQAGAKPSRRFLFISSAFRHARTHRRPRARTPEKTLAGSLANC